MRFTTRQLDEPEINLIPFIDILLVVVIFLTLSTTYARYQALGITLPQSGSQSTSEAVREVVVVVDAKGHYRIDQAPLPGNDTPSLMQAIQPLMTSDQKIQLVISADALASHQSVINVMDAARQLGLDRLRFATQNTRGNAR